MNFKFSESRKIDYQQFSVPTSDEIDTRYGLPSSVKFCKKCVISNQRPNSAVEFSHTAKSKKQTISFDQNLICISTLIHF